MTWQMECHVIEPNHLTCSQIKAMSLFIILFILKIQFKKCQHPFQPHNNTNLEAVVGFRICHFLISIILVSFFYFPLTWFLQLGFLTLLDRLFCILEGSNRVGGFLVLFKKVSIFGVGWSMVIYFFLAIKNGWGFGSWFHWLF